MQPGGRAARFSSPCNLRKTEATPGRTQFSGELLPPQGSETETTPGRTPGLTRVASVFRGQAGSNSGENSGLRRVASAPTACRLFFGTTGDSCAEDGSGFCKPGSAEGGFQEAVRGRDAQAPRRGSSNGHALDQAALGGWRRAMGIEPTGRCLSTCPDRF